AFRGDFKSAGVTSTASSSGPWAAASGSHIYFSCGTMSVPGAPSFPTRRSSDLLGGTVSVDGATATTVASGGHLRVDYGGILTGTASEHSHEHEARDHNAGQSGPGTTEIAFDGSLTMALGDNSGCSCNRTLDART